MPLGDVLRLDQDPVEVVTTHRYPSAGVLNRGRGLFNKGTLGGSETSYSRLFRLSEGQIVYSKLFGWEGAVALVPSEFDGHFVSSEFPTFLPDPDRMVPGFLEQFLKSAQFTDEMARSTNGLGQRRQRVNVDAFLRIAVPLPPVGQQDRIAAHLSRLGRSGPVMLSHQGMMLEQMLARSTAGVPRQRLRELMRSSRQWLDIDVSESYQPIGVRGFGRGMIRYPEMPAESLSKLRYYPIEPGALIVSNIKAWEGAVCIAEPADAGRIASNRFLQYVPTSEAVATPWVEQYLLSTEGIASLAAASPGSADRNRTLSMAAFESIEIPVPEVRVQHAVVRIAHALRRVQAQQARRDRLAAAILPAARNQIFGAMSSPAAPRKPLPTSSAITPGQESGT